MRFTSILFAASAALLCGTAVSSAADLIIEDVAAVETYDAADWSGLYAGLHIGLGSGVMVEQDSGVTPAGVGTLGGLGLADDEYGYEPSGFLAGAQVGALYQTGMFVLGVQGDVSWTNLEGGYLEPGFDESTTDVATIDWIANLTGRAGVAFDQVLLYALAGVSMAGVSIDYEPTNPSNTHMGYTIGIGGAIQIDDSWSVFAEYAYSDYGQETYNFDGDEYDLDLSISTVKVGLNYSF